MFLGLIGVAVFAINLFSFQNGCFFRPIVKNKNVSGVAAKVTNSKGDDLNEVVKVVDGDTVIINYKDKEERVRLIGVNTPETVDLRRRIECFGHEASAFTKNLLDQRRVKLELDPSQGERDKYGRLLAYLFLDSGELVNLKIIEGGYGYEYTYHLPYKYQKEFKEAESQAKAAGLGLWAKETCNGKK